MSSTNATDLHFGYFCPETMVDGRNSNIAQYGVLFSQSGHPFHVYSDLIEKSPKHTDVPLTVPLHDIILVYRQLCMLVTQHCLPSLSRDLISAGN